MHTFGSNNAVLLRFATMAVGALLCGAPLATWAGGLTGKVGSAANPEPVLEKLSSGMSSVKSPSNGSSGGGTWNSLIEGYAYSSGAGEVKARNAANVAAVAEIAVDNGPRRFSFKPPTGARFNGGKLLVYASLVNGDIVGSGTLQMKIDVTASRFGWPDQPTGGDEISVTNRPGSEDVELVAQVALPAYLDSTLSFSGDLTLLLKATANVAGGGLQTASASAKSRTTGFAVLDAAGKQVTGFTVSGASVLTERVAPAPPVILAVEYFNASFQHFFISANPDEIKGLDSGTAWKRTGEMFNVYATPDSGRLGVCRFFGVFPQPSGPAKSSHFYALRGLGCEALLVNPGPWQYEGDVFFMPPPAANGACPSGTVPVFRLYNEGKSGAPNHRYTTSEETQGEMIADGYTREGAGENGVAMCSPQ